MIVIGDTSGLIAALNTDSADHHGAVRAMNAAALIAVSPLVMQEIEHVVTRNLHRKAALQINDWLLATERTGRVRVVTVPSETLRLARLIQDRYADLRLDLADAVNIVVAGDFETDAVLTLDRRDFRAVRNVAGGPFRLLPDDM